MNILCIANFQAECSGNFINSLMHLANRLKEKSHNITFMFPKKNDMTECSWINYIRQNGFDVILLNNNTQKVEKEKILFQVINNKKIDLIHNHFSFLNDICLWNQELHTKVKILYHDHMDYLAEKSIFPQIRKQLKLARRYRMYGIGVISVMKLKHFWYWPCPNRWYVPNAITYERNIKHSLTREEARNILNLKCNEKMILFLGWDYFRKGLDIALKAIEKIRKNFGKNYILGLAGFDKDPNEQTLERIKEAIGMVPLQEGVRFLGSWEDMFALHRAADVFLSASRKEAFSYAILEAISQNVPVVVSNIKGTRWCYKYSKSIHFPSENVEACAEAIVKASTMREMPSNYQDIISQYNIDEWCSRVISIYELMLKK